MDFQYRQLKGDQMDTKYEKATTESLNVRKNGKQTAPAEDKTKKKYSW